MSTEEQDRRRGALHGSPGLRAWGDAHPAAAAAVQGLVFGILMGVFLVLTVGGPLGWNVALAAAAAVLFGLVMWVAASARRRRATRA